MFDLMEAIRKKLEAPPPADSADSAESAQPRGLEVAEGLRKTADSSAGDYFSAQVRKNPQAQYASQSPETEGRQGFSANPQNPQTDTDKDKQNPDAVLLEIAQALNADSHMLRALLSDDDMQDIADGEHSRAYLIAYFTLMRADGKKLSND